MLTTIFTFLITLSILIIFHELGHFLAAKKAGIKIEEFGLGYPPRIWAKKIGETIYSINWIPFGGFVRLFGEDRIDPKRKKGAFWAKSKKARLAVICAGVLANILLAFLIFSTVYMIVGIPVKTGKIIIDAIVTDSPAFEAGLKPGDVVISLNEEKIISLDAFIEKVDDKKGQIINLSIKRGEEEIKFELVPRQEVPEEQGPLGVIVSSYEMKRFPFWQMPIRSLIEGAKETYGWLTMIIGSLLLMLKNLIFTGRVPQDIAGPLGILQVTSHVAQSGLVAVLQFIGILSVNLAIINILPFPALDGGRFVFLVFEALTGKRSHQKVERWVHTAGMAFLLFLMLLVTINDVKRILTTTQFGLRLQSLWPF